MKRIDKTGVLIIFGVIIAIVQTFLMEYPQIRVFSGVAVLLTEFVIWNMIKKDLM